MADVVGVSLSDLVALRRHVERLISGWGAAEEGREWVPAVDVLFRDGQMEARVEVPGTDVRRMQVKLSGSTLTVRGEREREAHGPGEAYLVRESPWGAFERRISLPQGVDPAAVRAAYKEGVLVVTVPLPPGAEREAIGRAEEAPARPEQRGEASPARERRPPAGTEQAGTTPGGTAPAGYVPHQERVGGSPYEPLEEPAAPSGGELRYEPGHIPSQEEWLGRTSSEEESLHEAAERQVEGTGGLGGQTSEPATYSERQGPEAEPEGGGRRREEPPR